jgi:hypothetical protein
MIFNRELAVGTFDLFAGSVAIDAQDFVVVAFNCHRRKTVGLRGKKPKRRISDCLIREIRVARGKEAIR